MKKLAFLVALLAWAAFRQAAAQPFADARAYLAYLGETYTDLAYKTMEHSSFVVYSKDPEAVEQQRGRLVAEVRAKMSEMRRQTPCKGGETLQKNAVNILQLLVESYEVDFTEAARLKARSETSYMDMERYYAALGKAAEKLELANKRYERVYEEFAEANEIQLKDNGKSEIQKQIETVAELNGYTRKAHLAYFRVVEDNNRFHELMGKEKYDLAGSAREVLLKHANESIRLISGMKPFRGDDHYRQAVLETLENFRRLALHDYQTLVDLAKQESMTQEEADEYNKIVNDYNRTANKVIAKMHNASEKIWRKNVPRRVKRK